MDLSQVLVFGLSRYGSACCFVVESIVLGLFMSVPCFLLWFFLLFLVWLTSCWTGLSCPCSVSLSPKPWVGLQSMDVAGSCLSYPFFCQILHGVSSSGLNGGCSQVTILINIAKVRK